MRASGWTTESKGEPTSQESSSFTAHSPQGIRTRRYRSSSTVPAWCACSRCLRLITFGRTWKRRNQKLVSQLVCAGAEPNGRLGRHGSCPYSLRDPRYAQVRRPRLPYEPEESRSSTHLDAAPGPFPPAFFRDDSLYANGARTLREKWKEAVAANEDAAKAARTKEVAVAATCSLAAMNAAKRFERHPQRRPVPVTAFVRVC